MGRSLPELSLKEKVLLWIRHVERRSGDDAGLAATQAGIAEATGLSRGHVSRTVAPLIQDGLLNADTRRVPGFARALKGYALTEAGRHEADHLVATLHACDVEVRSAGTAPQRVPLAEVVRKGIAGSGTWPALHQVWSRGFVDREAGSAPVPATTRWLREMADAPSAGVFLGRSTEVATIERWLRGPSRIMYVEGHGGLGKTTLVGQTVRELEPRRHVVWIRITDWMTGADLVARLDRVLAQLGHAPRRAAPEDPGGVREHLARRAHHLALLLVLDDVQKAAPRLLLAIEGVVRALREAPSGKILLVGRRIDLPPHLGREAQRLLLSPLVDDAADRLLAERGVSAAQRHPLVIAAQGNPLFLELMSQTGGRARTGPGTGREVADHLVRDLAGDLPKPHRELLDWCSATRAPVPRDLWQRLGVGSDAALDEVMAASLVKRRDDGRLEMHDLVRDAFYSQLPFDRARMIHVRLANAFRPRSGNLSDVAEFLHHLVRAGRREEAVRWVLRNRTRLIDEAHRMFQRSDAPAEPGRASGEGSVGASAGP